MQKEKLNIYLVKNNQTKETAQNLNNLIHYKVRNDLSLGMICLPFF